MGLFDALEEIVVGTLRTTSKAVQLDLEGVAEEVEEAIDNTVDAIEKDL